MLQRLLLMTPGVLFVVCLLFLQLPNCSGHGRLIEPPSRASAWRYGFQTPPNYNDHELYCGGFTRQWKNNEGKCGECGDAYDLPIPRPHEFGGKWGQGVVVRKYSPDSDMTIRVELTASHMGYFEFRICPEIKAKQDCFDKYLLKVVGGSPNLPGPNDLETRFYPRNGSRIYDIKAKLPAGVKCSQCVLQWRYIAGNNWGMCDGGVGAVGCGPQEEFRACADISIGEGGRTTMRPFRPGVKTSTTPMPFSTETPEAGTEEDKFQSVPFVAPLIIGLSLLIVLCILASIYLYHYHGQKIKTILRWKQQKESSVDNGPVSHAYDNETKETESKTAAMLPPVPPPRNKRLSQMKELSPDQSSVA